MSYGTAGYRVDTWNGMRMVKLLGKALDTTWRKGATYYVVEDIITEERYDVAEWNFSGEVYTDMEAFAWAAR